LFSAAKLFAKRIQLQLTAPGFDKRLTCKMISQTVDLWTKSTANQAVPRFFQGYVCAGSLCKLLQ
jgi:hypothetical protein